MVSRSGFDPSKNQVGVSCFWGLTTLVVSFQGNYKGTVAILLRARVCVCARAHARLKMGTSQICVVYFSPCEITTLGSLKSLPFASGCPKSASRAQAIGRHVAVHCPVSDSIARWRGSRSLTRRFESVPMGSNLRLHPAMEVSVLLFSLWFTKKRILVDLSDRP